MRQLSRKNLTRCNALLLAPTMLYLLTSYERDPCAVGSNICGIRIISLAARFRTAASSGTLVNGLAKIRAAREYDRASIYAHS